MSDLQISQVSKAFHEEQLARRANFLSKIEASEEDTMERIVTEDESCSHKCGPESKVQWIAKESAGPVKFKADTSAQKVMATVFKGVKEIILVDFCEGLRRLRGYFEDVILLRNSRKDIQHQ